jgi:hypothetical protein
LALRFGIATVRVLAHCDPASVAGVVDNLAVAVLAISALSVRVVPVLALKDTVRGVPGTTSDTLQVTALVTSSKVQPDMLSTKTNPVGRGSVTTTSGAGEFPVFVMSIE